MDDVLRGLAIYLVLLLLFRLAGKRSVRDASTSDLLLLLVVGESAQQALAGQHFSLLIAALVVAGLLVIDRVMAFVRARTVRDRTRDTVPVVLVEHGVPLLERMAQTRITEEEILSHAQRAQGLESIDQIQYAVLEKSGGIGIVPRP